MAESPDCPSPTCPGLFVQETGRDDLPELLSRGVCLTVGGAGAQAGLGLLQGRVVRLSACSRLRVPWPPAVLQDLVDSCRQSVREHCTFSHQLQELRQWVTVVTQTLESHQRDVGPWDAASREAEVEVRWRPLTCVPQSSLSG